MPALRKRWQIAQPITPQASQNLAAYPPVFRQILFNRGLETFEAAEAFLRGRPIQPPSPFELLGMRTAVSRICQAISAHERIAVYGDYDVDGVTATALLTLALRAAGAQVREYIPNRFEEGYGLNKEALDVLKESDVRLVITVDCGVRSTAEAEHARSLGLDMIITDHHHPAAELPPAAAIINPKQPGCSYPYKELAGVGLAYKLVTALFSEIGMPPDAAEEYLDLVALGTVADIAPLDGENRGLVSAGLQRIRFTRRQGIASLIGSAGIGSRPVTAGDIGFILGPRLNAAGRLDSALAALQLLLCEDLLQAGVLAQQLEIQNRERQEITRQIQIQAETLATADKPDALLLFAVDPGFNSGVVGLAASRLTDQYYRPAIVGCQGEEFTRASCRSIPEFHITDALDRCADLLEHHGGHAAAAGFTVRNTNIPALVERLSAIAHEQLSGLDLLPVLAADVELPLSQLHPSLLPLLQLLEPTGAKNPSPAFVSRGVRVSKSRPVGKEEAHLKLSLTDNNITFDAIAFRKGPLHGSLPPLVDILYRFETNEYNGRKSLQLNIQDIQAH
jgi:single-stranded-DNA-specific exonuclease